MYIVIYVCMHIGVIYACTRYICIYVYIYICLCMYICMDASIYVCKCVYMNACMYSCMYVYICMSELGIVSFLCCSLCCLNSSFAWMPSCFCSLSSRCDCCWYHVHSSIALSPAQSTPFCCSLYFMHACMCVPVL